MKTKLAQAEATQYVVLLDLSASRDSFQQAQALSYLRLLAKSLSFGDELAVLKMQESGLRDHNSRFVQDMPVSKLSDRPSASERAALEDKRENLVSVLPSVVRAPQGRKAQHTDIFATLQLAAEVIRDRGPRQSTLVVLSDMLQSTSDIEMEGVHPRMPPRGWLEAQRSKGLIPALENACVLVAGTDATTAAGGVVRDFWIHYFNAAGARLIPRNYRATVPTVFMKDNCQ